MTPFRDIISDTIQSLISICEHVYKGYGALIGSLASSTLPSKTINHTLSNQYTNSSLNASCFFDHKVYSCGSTQLTIEHHVTSGRQQLGSTLRNLASIPDHFCVLS